MQTINRRTMLPVIVITLGMMLMIGLSVYHSQFQTTTQTNAAGTKPTKLYGTIEHLPTCVSNFLCYSLKSVDTTNYLLYSKKYSDGVVTNKVTDNNNDYSLLDLESYVGKNVRIEGFQVQQYPPYVIIVSIKEL